MIDRIYNLTDKQTLVQHNKGTLSDGNKKLVKVIINEKSTLHTFFYDMNDLMDAKT